MAKKAAKKAPAKKAKKKVAKKAAKKVAKKAKKVTKAPTEKKVAKKVAKKATKKVKKITKKQQKAIEAENELAKKWMALYRKHSDVKAKKYSMREQYEERTPIEHKVHGWGYILKNINDRLEVLFETGIKVLISNYKR